MHHKTIDGAAACVGCGRQRDRGDLEGRGCEAGEGSNSPDSGATRSCLTHRLVAWVKFSDRQSDGVDAEVADGADSGRA